MTPSPVSPRHGRPGSPWTELKGQPLAQGHEVASTVRRGTYDVVVDGKRAGSLEMNEAVDIPLEPGCHTVQVRNGRNSSRTKTFDVAKGGIASFRCGGKRILPIFLSSLVIPSRALSLKRN